MERQDISTLWYTKPAAEWEEALPLGNGRLGAMIAGNLLNLLHFQTGGLYGAASSCTEGKSVG